jgi:hypothetical protein
VTLRLAVTCNQPSPTCDGLLLGPGLRGTGTIALDPTFESSLFTGNQFHVRCTGFFGVQSVDTVGRWTTSYLLTGLVCLWCLVCNNFYSLITIFRFFSAFNVLYLQSLLCKFQLSNEVDCRWHALHLACTCYTLMFLTWTSLSLKIKENMFFSTYTYYFCNLHLWICIHVVKTFCLHRAIDRWWQ